jgi:hypothetical protein
MKNQHRQTRPTTKSVPKEPKALCRPTATAAPQRVQSERQVTVPPDPIARRRAVKDVFLNVVGANVFAAQMRTFVSEGDGNTAGKSAEMFFEAIRESVQPRDAIEEMLVVQMAWLHARIAKLSALAVDQRESNNARVVNDACDRAANTFRRMMLSLADYRRPAQPGSFVAIRHANVANQQVIANAQEPISQHKLSSNGQGSTSPALLSVSDGAGILTSSGAAKQTVVAEHGPQDGRGQDARQDERPETR